MDTPRRRREGVRDDSREALGANEGRAESLDGNLDVRIEEDSNTIRITRPTMGTQVERIEPLTSNGTVIIDSIGSTGDITRNNIEPTISTRRYSINPRSGEIDVRVGDQEQASLERIENERREFEESTRRLENIRREISTDFDFEDESFFDEL